MKMHIGSGAVYLPNFINVDIFSDIKTDIHSSALALPYEINTFDLIYASHILEHFSKRLTLSALTHWRSLLKPGGKLRLAVPNFDAVCQRYTQNGNLNELSGLLYGGQKFLLDVHYTTFDEKTLTEQLLQVGFKEIRTWDWRETEHSQFDDYSQAYLPHLQKDTGQLMSLNIEAIK